MFLRGTQDDYGLGIAALSPRNVKTSVSMPLLGLKSFLEERPFIDYF